MTYRFQYRRYRLPLRVPVRTAHGFWSEREGVLVRLEWNEDGAPRAGLGEAAPIPEFGTETVDEIEDACRTFGEVVDDDAIAALPASLGCLRHAFDAARQPAPASAGRYLGIAALLPAGRGAIDVLKEKADAGFRVFKWKVGVGDPADELVLLDDLCAAMPEGARLRLDANGAWDRRTAERWLERGADRPIEFIEQPCLIEPPAARRRRGEVSGREIDLLFGLAQDYPTPIALDESLVGDGDVLRWLAEGWPGIYVLKPSLLGDVSAVLGKLASARERIVFSSALETAVGARAALRLAFAWFNSSAQPDAPPPRALGFGVWPLFADPRFDGPRAAPYLRAEDVENISAEAAWNALS